VPERLKTLFNLCMDSYHYYRQYWYWGGEAELRTKGTKLKPTPIPDAEWQAVLDEAPKFGDESAAKGPRSAKVVNILKAYNETMSKAGPPYRSG